MIRKTTFILAVLLTVVSCSRVPLTGRRQVSLLPEGMLVNMALTNYQEFLAENPPVPASDPRTRMVRNSGERISNAVNQYLIDNGEEDRVENFQWEFNLVENEAVNAWCMPGGKVVF